MFSFRRKPQKQASDDGGPPFIRSSPSLPELSAQGIPWPSNLVDVSELPQDEPPPPRGAAKTSFSAARGTVPFHKPWTSPGKAVESNGTGPISSLYMSHPPSAFESRKGSLQGRATADEI